MEENVALDSTKQKKFVKSLKGIKKLIKKTEENAEHVPLVLAPKKRVRVKKSKSKRKPKGLVYLSHIPHGFFEHQMTEYFKQFGGVTNVRVIRSKRTGNSRGCAFVEFKEPAVAEIVAETMNNYLMGKRIIKAEIIPPEKQKRARRMQWSSTNNPGFLLKKKIKKDFNTNKGDAGDLKRARNIVSNLLKTKAKLNAMGIQFDFAPVDIPEELQDNIKQLISNVEDVKEKEQEKKPSKKDKKDKYEDKKEISVNKKSKILEKNKNAKVENNKVANKKLKEKGVIPLDSFIKIQSDEDVSDEDSSDEELLDKEDEETSEENEDEEQSGEESDDSAVDFDDEAYDKMAESSESLLTDEEEPEGINESESDEEEPPIIAKKKNKNKGELKQIAPTIQKKSENKKVQLAKRKAAQKVEISPKKPKFEKKNDKKLNKKQFKVK